jgi:hypothetical protein
MGLDVHDLRDHDDRPMIGAKVGAKVGTKVGAI